MNLALKNNNNFSIYLFSIIIALIIAITLPYLPILILVPFFVLFYFIHRNNFIIAIIIVAFVTATSFIIEEMRPYLNLLLIFLTGLVFFRYFGLDFQKYPRLPKIYLLFLGLLFSSLILATLFSNDFSISAVATLRTAIFLLLCYSFYAFLFEIKDTYLYIYALFLAVIILAIGIFIQILEAGFTIFLIKGGLARFAGFYANPNYVGQILIISVPFITTFYFRERFKEKIKMHWLTVFLILNLCLIFAIDSRASALAIFISTSFILLALNRRFYFKMIFSMAVVFIILYQFPSIQELVDIFMRLERAGTRMYFWDAGFDVIFDYPIVGIGPDLFQRYIFNYLPSKAYAFYHPDVWFGKANPHSFYLLIISENGLLGILTSISIVILYFYLGFRAIKITKREYRDLYLLSITLTGIGLGIFTRAFFEVTGIMSYGYITRDLPFWLLLSILLYINANYSESSTKQLKALELLH